MGDIKNAIIESTMLGKTRGIMTFIIYIKFDKCIKCGVGLYAAGGSCDNTSQQ